MNINYYTVHDMFDYRETFIASFLRNTVIIICFVLIVCFTGCSSEQKYAPFREDLNTAIDLMANNEYLAAIDSLKGLVASLHNEEQNDYVKEITADVEYALGEAYESCGEYNFSYDSFNSALVYYKDIFGAESDKTVDTLLRVVDLESKRLQMKDVAIKQVTELLEMNISDKYHAVTVCYAAQLNLDMDNREKAENYISMVLPLIDELSGKSDEEVSDILKSMGIDEESETDKLLGKTSVSDRYLEAFSVLGSYYSVNHMPDKEIEIDQRALEFLEKQHIGTELDIATAYMNLGCNHIFYNEAPEDNEYLRKAKEMIENSSADLITRADLNFLLAESYHSMNKQDEYGSYLLEAQKHVIEALGETSSYNALICVMLSEYYRYAGKYNDAVKSCEKSVEIYKDLLKEDSYPQGAAYNHLANCYVTIGNKSKASEAYENAIKIYSNIGSDLQVAVTERNYALFCNNTLCNHSKALTNALDAVRIADNMDHTYYGTTLSAIYMLMHDILTSSDKEYQLIEEYTKKAYECLQNTVGNNDEYYGYYHYNYGKYLYDNYRTKEALEHLLDAEGYFLNVYKEYKLYPINIFYDIANCYYRLSEYASAKKYYEKSVDLATARIALLEEQGSNKTGYLNNTLNESRNKLRILKDH